jgi:hypothetical protein
VASGRAAIADLQAAGADAVPDLLDINTLVAAIM